MLLIGAKRKICKIGWKMIFFTRVSRLSLLAHAVHTSVIVRILIIGALVHNGTTNNLAHALTSSGTLDATSRSIWPHGSTFFIFLVLIEYILYSFHYSYFIFSDIVVFCEQSWTNQQELQHFLEFWSMWNHVFLFNLDKTSCGDLPAKACWRTWCRKMFETKAKYERCDFDFCKFCTDLYVLIQYTGIWFSTVKTFSIMMP